MTTLQPAPSAPSSAQWTAKRHEDAAIITSVIAGRPQPDDWQQRLMTHLALPGVQIVGAKRHSRDGSVFSMGDFLVHPKGFHHHGRGAPGEALRFPEEVDAITAGVCAVDAHAFDAAGGDNMLHGALGMIELCLRIRQAGGRCVAVPDVTVVDESSPQPDERESRAFRQRWGFDWNAADLDAVRLRWAGTGLLWNLRFHGAVMPFAKYDTRPAMHWDSYAAVEPYRQRVNHLVKLVAQHATAGDGPVLDLGCGDGLFSHLIAEHRLEVIGIDTELAAIEQAIATTRQRQYPTQSPRFLTGDGAALPLDDESVQAVAMFDVIEHLPNPIRVLREATRVLKPGGHLMLSTPAWQLGAWSDPVYHVTEYTIDELTRQITATGLAIVNTGTIGGVYRDLIVIARRAAAVP